MELIKINDLFYKYNKTDVLEDINLSIKDESVIFFKLMMTEIINSDFKLILYLSFK